MADKTVQLFPDPQSSIFSDDCADMVIRAHVGPALWNKHVRDKDDVHLCFDISHGAYKRESKEDRIIYCTLKVLLIQQTSQRPGTGRSERSIGEDDLRRSPMIANSYIKTIVRSPEPSTEDTHDSTTIGLTANAASHGTAEVKREVQVSQHTSHTAKATIIHDRSLAKVDMHENRVSARGISKRVIVALQFQSPPIGLYKIHYELITQRHSTSKFKQWRRWLTRSFGRTVYATHDESLAAGNHVRVQPVILEF